MTPQHHNTTEPARVAVAAALLEPIDAAVPVEADGTVRCVELGETSDGRVEIRLESGTLRRVWVVEPAAIRRRGE